jgi:class 3 adenylate cyclase
MAENSNTIAKISLVEMRILNIVVFTFILICVLGINSYINSVHFRNHYTDSLMRSYSAVGGQDAVQLAEYALKYGKALDSFDQMRDELIKMKGKISQIQSIYFISVRGDLIHSSEDDPLEEKERLNLLDLYKNSGNQGYTHSSERGEYISFLPVKNQQGAVEAIFFILISEKIVNDQTNNYLRTLLLMAILLIVVFTTVFVIIFLKKNFIIEEGEGHIRKYYLITVLISTVTIVQIISSGINIFLFNDIYYKITQQNTLYLAELIQKNIDSVISKGINYKQIYDLDKWIGQVTSDLPEIESVIITDQDNNVIYSSSQSEEPITQMSTKDSHYYLPLSPDATGFKPTLHVNLSDGYIRSKLFKILTDSGIVLIVSLLVMIQFAFILIIVLNRGMMSKLQKDNEYLEEVVKERTREIEESRQIIRLEKEKSDKLLLNILPQKVADDLKNNGTSDPEMFEDVTVFFSDIVGFTSLSEQLRPKVLIDELNILFTEFDTIIEKNNCERIKTIGDAYLAVCGMPVQNENHAINIVNSALEILNFVERKNSEDEIEWKIRIGIHTGDVVGGVVGVKKYIYDVFGDAINTASRMESNSAAMRINVSESTYKHIRGKYKIGRRKPVEVKGKGVLNMFYVLGNLGS